MHAATDRENLIKEIFDQKVKKANQVNTKGIEVGHIFYFGEKYSKPLNLLNVNTKDGKKTSSVAWDLME